MAALKRFVLAYLRNPAAGLGLLLLIAIIAMGILFLGGVNARMFFLILAIFYLFYNTIQIVDSIFTYEIVRCCFVSSDIVCIWLCYYKTNKFFRNCITIININNYTFCLLTNTQHPTNVCVVIVKNEHIDIVYTCAQNSLKLLFDMVTWLDQQVTDIHIKQFVRWRY